MSPLYWCLGLPCLLLPGFLLLALMPCYYITKRADYSSRNLAGAFALAAVFNLYVIVWPVNFVIFAMQGRLRKEDIQLTKLLMPFTIGE